MYTNTSGCRGSACIRWAYGVFGVEHAHVVHDGPQVEDRIPAAIARLRILA